MSKDTTKYEAVLPPQYYLNNINEQSPEKKEKWFVRAHHLETLTSNFFPYFSHRKPSFKKR